MQILIAFILLLIPALSFAQGPTLGPNCKASWVAPTTRTDGTALPPGELTAYRIYIDKPTIVPGVTPPSLTVGPTVTGGVSLCAGLAAGNHTWTVSAVGLGEGPAAAAFPFVLVTATPAPPSSLGVLP